MTDTPEDREYDIPMRVTQTAIWTVRASSPEAAVDMIKANGCADSEQITDLVDWEVTGPAREAR